MAIEGLQFIPVGENKRPIPALWNTVPKKHDFSRAQNVGLVCGRLSGNVEVVDIDCHHDKTGNVLADYKELLMEANPSLLRKLVIQETRNKGYHLIYRCETIEGNIHLANDAKAENGDISVLIETRGEGGQILVQPSTGYTIKQGALDKIPTITTEERATLHSCARMLNRYIEPYEPTAKKRKEMQEATPNETPWDDYNTRGDWQGLLEKHGWKYVKSRKGKHFFLRPGDSEAEYSGDFNENLNLFAVFSTSTCFEPKKGYTPFAIYAFLECNKDFSEAARRLLREGYGTYTAPVEKTPPPVLGKIDRKSFMFEGTRPEITAEKQVEILQDRGEIENYLHRVATGTLEMGLKTGMPGLDDYWLLKRNYFVIVNGFDNVGKSTFMWYVAFLSALFHGWKWAFLCMENMGGPVVEKLCGFYWSKHYALQTESEKKTARDFVFEHFNFLSLKKGWTYLEVLDAFSVLKSTRNICAGLIDPYRSLVYDAKNEYAYHSMAGNDFKRFAQQMGVSIYVNIHATGSSARNYNKETQAQRPPTKADVEYGGAWTGPVDDFLTVHRLLGNPELKYQTQVFVRKIKERETGGDWTGDDNPVILKMPKGVNYVSATEFDPVAEHHRNGYRPSLYVPDSTPAPLRNLGAEKYVNGFEAARKPSTVFNPYEVEKFELPTDENEAPF